MEIASPRLLKLRGISYGERMDGVLNCSHCGAKLDLDLHADQLLLPPYDQPAPTYEVSADGVAVVFRLPNGEDETIAARLPVDQAEAENPAALSDTSDARRECLPETLI